MIQFICLSLILSFNLFASRQVTLLVSVEGSTRVLFKVTDTTKRLVDQFRNQYSGIKLPLKIIANANQEDLHRELLNPENEGVFWVSHANSFDQGQGLGNEDTIIDIEGNNVKDLFQQIHPSIRFVAVLGCRTAPIIEGFRQKGFYADNKDLFLYARDKKINGIKEIKKALEVFKNLSPSEEVFCPQLEGFPVKMKRVIGKDQGGKSIKIMNRDKFLGLFPAGSPGEIQELSIYVPAPKTVHDLKFIIDSHTDKISIQSHAFNGEWKVFSDSSGRPIGVGQNIYRFSGSPAPVSASESYLPYKCE